MVINTAEIFIVTTNKNIIKQKISFTKKTRDYVTGVRSLLTVMSTSVTDQLT